MANYNDKTTAELQNLASFRLAQWRNAQPNTPRSAELAAEYDAICEECARRDRRARREAKKSQS